LNFALRRTDGTFAHATLDIFFIGLIYGVVNIATVSFLMLFGLSLEISTPASFLVAAALNYILCIALLFRHEVKWNTAGSSLPIS
jgi:hypothetical protein